MAMVIAGAASGSGVKFMLEKLDYLITKQKEILSVHKGAEDISNELEILKSIVSGAETEEHGDLVRTLMKQVRRIASSMEDVLDAFDRNFGQPHRNGFVASLYRLTHNVKHLGDRNRIGKGIKKIRRQLHNLSTRTHLAFSLSQSQRVGRSCSSAASGRLDNRHVSALFTPESELVGIDGPREELVAWLLGEELQLKVKSVAGMGGLGKTTLVRKVFDDGRVQDGFDCHIWIPVTQSLKIEEFLRCMIYRLLDSELLPERVDTMEGDQLTERIHGYLQNKRYVIVFDDIWDIRAWNGIKSALPNNMHRSRVLITTRNRGVAERSGYVYDLLPLSSPDSRKLFCINFFASIPPELKDLTELIVERCHGLPLVIVTTARLLCERNMTFIVWKKFFDNIYSILASNINHDEIRSMLSLNYNELPQVLKYCVLFFGIFPKNYPVSRNTLVQLWMAEGFLSSDRNQAMEEDQEVAESYFNDLVKRNLVQVAELSDYGKVRSYKVHALIHELIVLKSEEENFSTSIVGQNPRKHQAARRLAIQNTREDFLPTVSISHLRALFLFETMSVSFMHDFYSSLRFLRILCLDGVPIEKFPVDFSKLIHLRYLSLRNTKINKLSKSLGKLKYLETLNLKGTRVSKLPKNILNLKRLRYIHACRHYTGTQQPRHGVMVPKGIGTLKNLQKLSYVELNQDSAIVRELGSLTQLNRLGVVNLRGEDVINLCTAVEKMEKLLSLSVASTDEKELIDLRSLSPAPQLKCLYLRAYLQILPVWVASLNNLVRMRLRCSKLREDPFRLLQGLHNLAELELIGAYDGAQLCCEGGFRKLEVLNLQQLEELNKVEVKEAMHNLRKLIIGSCKQLESVSFLQLTGLQELHLIDMPEQFVVRLQGTDRQEVQHIQLIQIYDKNSVVTSYD